MVMLEGKKLMCLPDCVLVHVLSYLQKRELMKYAVVCKRWSQLCFDRYLWKEICTKEFRCINIDDVIVTRLLQYAKSIQKLSLHGCYQVSNKVLKHLALNGSRLQELKLENCFRITDRGIISIAKSCSSLKVINVLNTLVTETGLCYLINENPHLLELTANPVAMTETTASTLTQKCKSLEYLHIEQDELTPFTKTQCKFVALTTSMMEMIAFNCPKLQVLILRYPVTSVSDRCVGLIGQHCKRLECFEIGHRLHTSVVTDMGLINLCVGSTNLLRLDLAETFATDYSLTAIAKHCPRLEHLSLGQTGPVSDIGVMTIMKHCENLDSFSVRCCYHNRLTDLSVFAIVQSACSLNLTNLALKHWEITDFGMYVLAKNLPKLMYLSVEGCMNLTNKGLKEALKYFQAIRSLDISRTKCVVNDSQLVELTKLLPEDFQSLFLQASSPLNPNQEIRVTEKGCLQFNETLPECEIVFVH